LDYWTAFWLSFLVHGYVGLDFMRWQVCRDKFLVGSIGSRGTGCNRWKQIELRKTSLEANKSSPIQKIGLEMKRFHLFEFEDQSWFPRFMRDAGTTYLQFISHKFRVHEVMETDTSLCKESLSEIILAESRESQM
jgi:hypothetical protein